MCGILGYISSTKISQEKFNDTLKLIVHRGPDNLSSIFETTQNKEIALGHTRLSIIDLSEKSNQPLTIGEYTIIFNGEIYNYKALKVSLEKNGVVFTTQSDTEIILQSYIKYGMRQTIDTLKGMFAFAILDKKENKIILARDRIGIKPLYYLLNDNNFIFSSEIKTIKNLSKDKLKIDEESSANYYYHRHINEPKTIYKEINAVESGQYLELELKNFLITKINYWTLIRSSKEQDEKKVIDKVEELLNESVKEHLVSDVPISFAFSGGVDSSLLISIAKQYQNNITAFTIKRSDNDIDWIYSKKIAKYLNIKQKINDFNNLDIDGVDKRLYKIYDQPIGCSSIFSTYLLYKTMTKEFKVCISGDGGDEIFGGYNWYQHFLDTKHPTLNILRSLNRLRTFIRHKYFFPKNDIEKYKKIMLDRFTKIDIEKLLDNNIKVEEIEMYKKYIEKIDSIQDMMYVDFFTFLRYNLIRLDLSSMAHSLESRVPFLDHKLVEYAYTIDPKLHYKNGELKYILKKVAERYLPKKYIYRPKKGFSAPIMNVLPVKSGKEGQKYIFNQWKEYHN